MEVLSHCVCTSMYMCGVPIRPYLCAQVILVWGAHPCMYLWHMRVCPGLLEYLGACGYVCSCT